MSRGASSAQAMALAMSRACTSGRHGVPSLVILILPVVHATPARLFITRSKRIRGDAPNAVALRRNVGEKSSSAMAPTSRSTNVLQTAYSVRGSVGESSSTVPLATPYTLHDEVYTNRLAPASFA